VPIRKRARSGLCESTLAERSAGLGGLLAAHDRARRADRCGDVSAIEKERERLLRVSEVAGRLCCGTSTVYRMVATGRLPALRLGDERGPIRVAERELEAWLWRPEARSR
jgi:excisionase family DNA binding protein